MSLQDSLEDPFEAFAGRLNKALFTFGAELAQSPGGVSCLFLAICLRDLVDLAPAGSWR